MKVLHITPTYVPAYAHGGPIWSVHNMNKWLVKSGVDVTVYTTNLEGRKEMDVPLMREVIRDGVRVIYFPSKLFKLWEYSYEMHRALRNDIANFDIIHITSVFRSVSTLGAYYAKRAHVPYIISPRGTLMAEPLRLKNRAQKSLYINLIEKRNLKDASAIHFTTEEERREYKKLDIPMKYSFVVPNGLDLEEFEDVPEKMYFRKKLGISPEKRIILFLGRISWKKGFDTLIPAFQVVVKQYPGAVLVIAGSDEEGYRKTVEMLVLKHDLTKQVIFSGMLLGKEKLSAFRDADAFVLPSYAENFGMAVAEALFLKVPVVISEGVAIAQEIKNHNAGLVVKKDREEIARAIIEVLKNKSSRTTMGEKGHQFVKDSYSLPKLTDQLINEYNRVIKDYRP